MQAAIALCYFCENHGPRVVMICQPMRNNVYEKSIDCYDDLIETNENGLPQFYGNLNDCDQEIQINDEERCAACSSFGNGLGILSNDHEAETSYVSTQMPVHDCLHNMVKQACIRSLSVEISTPLFVETNLSEPCTSNSNFEVYNNQNSGISKEFFDKDGVVLFGDEKNGYTLSHTFRLKDAKARGFSRSYSLIVISRDKLMLLSNYEFFLGGFSAIISKLQSMAFECFAMEEIINEDLRLVAATQSATSSNNNNINNRIPWLSYQFYPKHFALDTSRSLTKITNNKNIFTILHRQMLYLLKTQTTLEKDTVLEGVPTQDMLVLKEMERNNIEENDLVTSFSPQQSFFHLKNLQTIVQQLHGNFFDEKLTNTYLQQNENCNDLLTELFWHIITGGQVVVKSDVPEARRLFLLALIHLLPIGCVRLASNLSHYIYSYKYNFIGLNIETEIPEDVKDEIFLIYLKLKTKMCFNNLFSNLKIQNAKLISTAIKFKKDVEFQSEKENNNIFNEDLNLYNFIVEKHVKKSGTKPKLLERYLNLLLDIKLDIATLDSALRATRNDWLNYAKLIFQLRHQKEGINISKIIQIIKCSNEDLPVLLFWQSGLSQRYKKLVLSTINNSSVAGFF